MNDHPQKPQFTPQRYHFANDPSPPHPNERSQATVTPRQERAPCPENEPTLDLPQWKKYFPFIRHNDVDPDIRKELWKSVLKHSEWDKISGELP